MSTFVIILILISSITLIEVKILNVLSENEGLPTISSENLLVDNDILNLLVNRINESSEKIVDLQKQIQYREEHGVNENSERIAVLEQRVQKFEEHYREFSAQNKQLQQREEHGVNEDSERITVMEKRLQKYEEQFRYDIEQNNLETKVLKAGLLKNPQIKRHFKTHCPIINEQNEKSNNLCKKYSEPKSEKSDNVTLIKNKSFVTGRNKSINVSYEDKHIVYKNKTWV